MGENDDENKMFYDAKYEFDAPMYINFKELDQEYLDTDDIWFDSYMMNKPSEIITDTESVDTGTENNDTVEMSETGVTFMKFNDNFGDVKVDTDLSKGAKRDVEKIDTIENGVIVSKSTVRGKEHKIVDSFTVSGTSENGETVSENGETLGEDGETVEDSLDDDDSSIKETDDSKTVKNNTITEYGLSLSQNDVIDDTVKSISSGQLTVSDKVDSHRRKGLKTNVENRELDDTFNDNEKVVEDTIDDNDSTIKETDDSKTMKTYTITDSPIAINRNNNKRRKRDTSKEGAPQIKVNHVLRKSPSMKYISSPKKREKTLEEIDIIRETDEENIEVKVTIKIQDERDSPKPINHSTRHLGKRGRSQSMGLHNPDDDSENIPRYLKSTISSRIRLEEKLRRERERLDEKEQEESIYDFSEHKITIPKTPNLNIYKRTNVNMT